MENAHLIAKLQEPHADSGTFILAKNEGGEYIGKNVLANGHATKWLVWTQRELTGLLQSHFGLSAERTAEILSK